MAEIALTSLEICMRNLYKNIDSGRETAGYLTELGYEGCYHGVNIDADRVKDVLHQEVIIRCFTKRVDLTTDPPDEQGLNELLCDSLPESMKKRRIDSYFRIDKLVKHRLKLTCPLDFIEKKILYPSTIQTFLKKFIECQFQLKWATSNGWPREFSYYKFCDVMISQPWIEKSMRETVLKNRVRNAQVKVQLYRHYMTHIRNEFEDRDLCPTVYVRTGKKRWRSLNRELVALEGDGVDQFNWINEPIQSYILSKAEINPEAELGDAGLTKWLTKHTLYWAVVEDSNFQAGKNLKLNEIGRTQVYVGKANNGIKDRWLTSPSSHCRKMKRCLSVFHDKKAYNAELVSDVQLVDAVLLLEKLKGNTNSALFLMKTFGNEQELEDTEKRNIVGKNMPSDDSDNPDIIPLKELYPPQEPIVVNKNPRKLDNRPRWEPINMAYGMNVIK